MGLRITYNPEDASIEVEARPACTNARVGGGTLTMSTPAWETSGQLDPTPHSPAGAAFRRSASVVPPHSSTSPLAAGAVFEALLVTGH
jgi:hypothetical protein